ncbi:MAG: hypothetical protein ABSE77_07030 [Acidimicrobiales bacterium]|jgi:hypothetical protein
MSQDDSWSPDEASGTEVFEQGDEALDEQSRTDPDFIEELQQDPSLDPTLLVDEREIEEAGAGFDDPESLAALDGGFDDPDGAGGRAVRPRRQPQDEDGWDLDKPLVNQDETDDGLTE